MTTTTATTELTTATKAAYTAISTYRKAQTTLTQKLTAAYGTVWGAQGPSYVEYRNAAAMLIELDKEKGNTGQWVRKVFAAFIKARYGALPKADNKEAERKRVAASNRKAEAQDAARAAGAESTANTRARRTSATESLEQMIARVGIATALEVIAKLLAVENDTAEMAMKVKALSASVKGRKAA